MTGEDVTSDGSRPQQSSRCACDPLRPLKKDGKVLKSYDERSIRNTRDSSNWNFHILENDYSLVSLPNLDTFQSSHTDSQ